MIVLSEINNREVLYVRHDLATNWFKDFPKSNWLLFAITDRWLPEIFEEISRRAVDNDVVYVCQQEIKRTFSIIKLTICWLYVMLKMNIFPVGKF